MITMQMELALASLLTSLQSMGRAVFRMYYLFIFYLKKNISVELFLVSASFGFRELVLFTASYFSFPRVIFHFRE